MANLVPKLGLILGTLWTGKTWAAGWIAARIRRPFVVVVTIRQDPAFLDHFRKPWTLCRAVTSPAPAITAAYLERIRERHRYLYLSLYDVSSEETNRFLESLVEAVKQSGDLCVVLDEAHMLCHRTIVSEPITRFMRGARHYGVDVLLVTHRLMDIDIGIRCVLTHLIVFRTKSSHDLKILERELDVPPETIRTIRQLRDQFHVFVNHRLGTISAPMKL